MAMGGNLGQIETQVTQRLGQLLVSRIVQIDLLLLQQLLQVVHQVRCHLAEVDHEVQRVLDLVGNARTEQSQRSQFLRLQDLLLQVGYLLFQILRFIHCLLYLRVDGSGNGSQIGHIDPFQTAPRYGHGDSAESPGRDRALLRPPPKRSWS